MIWDNASGGIDIFIYKGQHMKYQLYMDNHTHF